MCSVCHDPETVTICRARLSPGVERDIVYCAHCESAGYDPVPTPDEIARCYPHSYFDDFFRQYWKDYYKGRFLGERLARWKKNGAFLDVGCALGTLLAGVRDFSGWRVNGLEYMPFASEAGRELNGVEIATGGLLQAPWPAASFDYIHANNVIEHEADPVAALRQAAALLKDGGRLHLTIPNGPVDLRPNIALYERLHKAVRTRHSGHLFFFSRRALERLLTEAGFTVLAFKTFHLKSALKAYGWMPRAYRGFLKDSAPENMHASNDKPSVQAMRRLIPAQPSWPLYRMKSQWRQLWRWPFGTWGYDFEILAEKKS
jgi:SAM-dependent methyltransferase